MRALPFPFFDVTDDKIASIAYLVDELTQHQTSKLNENRLEIERELNRQIYACFNLNEREKVSYPRDNRVYHQNFS